MLYLLNRLVIAVFMLLNDDLNAIFLLKLHRFLYMIKIFFIAISFIFSLSTFAGIEKTDSEIKKEIISQSIASYSGNCPCPYNRASNGSRCGKRSAWSRAGGYAPICYDNEITEAMITRWKQKN